MGIIKNIFVTGKINAGKSTILNKLIEKLNISTSGFLTLPFIENNRVKLFYIKKYLSPMSENEKLNVIGKEISKGKWNGVTETFDTIGVDIINEALESNSQIIIMDELGFFESSAIKFQGTVYKALDSNKIVLGAIKYKSTDFLDEMRKRKDIKILEITEDNREAQYEKLKELVILAISNIGG